jgi:hypothetical protein
MMLSWNAGDLDRIISNDGLLRFITKQPWHIVCLQEAYSTMLGPNAQASGMHLAWSPTKECAMLAGASGQKSIHAIYGDWKGIIQRTEATTTDEAKLKAMDVFAVDISWIDEATGRLAERVGIDVLRVCSVHFHYAAAHAKRPSKDVLLSYFSLMIRDRVRIVTGDFNSAGSIIEPALLQLKLERMGVSYQLLVFSDKDHIDCIVFNYPSEPPLKAELRNSIQKLDGWEEWGYKEGDTSTHHPLIVIITKDDEYHGTSARSSWHQRSEISKKRRKKKERERGNNK